MSRRGRPKTTVCKGNADYVALNRLREESEEQRFAMRARLAKRDLDYTQSPCAAKVTVEELGNRVIETRGQTCIGFAAASFAKSV